MKLYRYFENPDYAVRFVERGEIMFSTLSHFRDLEGDENRGDPFEGNLRHRPASGLTLNMQDGRNVEMPGHEFRSRVDQDSIYVCCFSQSEGETLRQKFNATCCVEVADHMRLASKLRQKISLRSAFDRNAVFFGPVDYREKDRAPNVDWALPERIAFIKSPSFHEHDEFRFVVGRKGVFDAENVNLTIAPINEPNIPSETNPNRLLLRLGNIEKIARLHHF